MAVSAAAQQAYYKKMLPYGKKVEQKIGIPAATVVAWWSWETDFGTNNSSKHNNHAGIKANSKGRDYVAGIYAGYNSLDSFVADYCRILSLNAYGYPQVIKAGKDGKDTATITKAHNASSWSEADYNVTTIVNRANAVGKLLATTPPPAAPVAGCPKCPTCGQMLPH